MRRDLKTRLGVEGTMIADWCVLTTFRALSLPTILSIFSSALLEKPMLFVCSNLWLLSCVVLSVSVLIRPLRWQGLQVKNVISIYLLFNAHLFIRPPLQKRPPSSQPGCMIYWMLLFLFFLESNKFLKKEIFWGPLLTDQNGRYCLLFRKIYIFIVFYFVIFVVPFLFGVEQMIFFLLLGGHC